MTATVRLHLILLTALLLAAPLPARDVEIRGTYGGIKSFWQAGYTLDEFGINAVFVGSYGINDELIDRARAEGARVFSEFATLNGGRYVEEHPEAWPIGRDGERSPKADWFMGVCPTEPGFRTWRMKTLRELLRKHHVHGVWMDYVQWHAQFESPDPILPETCFCGNCLTAFSAATGVVPPPGSTSEKADWILAGHERQWRDWRCSVVTGWARDMREIIAQERPGALLGLYFAPWTDEQFDGARRRILGLDLVQLAEVVDVLSPMVYHGRMGRDPGWVGEYTAWLCGRLGLERGGSPRVWPIVQAADEPSGVTPAEFEKVLRLGVEGCADGVMMFTIHSIVDDPAKLEVMRKVYGEWKTGEQ